MLKKDALTATIAETVEETVKNLATLAQVIALVAQVTLDVTALLSKNTPLKFDQSESQPRGMKGDALAWKAAVRYREEVEQSRNS